MYFHCLKMTCMCMCMCLCVVCACVSVCASREGVGSLEAGIIGSCELPGVCAESQTQYVLSTTEPSLQSRERVSFLLGGISLGTPWICCLIAALHH